MKGFAVYYINALAACILLFGILLIHNQSSLDRQEKQIKLDRALISFMLYFLADCFWAAINDDILPKTRFSVVLDTFAIYLFMVAICYNWLEYAMAVVQLPTRNRPKHRFAMLFPFLFSTTALIINYLIAPQLLIDDNLDTRSAFSIYLMATPVIYLGIVLFYCIRRARSEENPAEKRRHLFIGFLPLSAIIAGLLQEVFFNYIPIYCFADSLLILIFYIQSIEARVSLDPLTNLNNRGELMRYISQKSNIYQENRLTVVIMMDINSFKMINDTYGHAEGDNALVLISESLKKVIGSYSMPSFLGRYGGDEFIFIIHPLRIEETESLVNDIRSMIERDAEEKEIPYALTVSIGYDELKGGNDSIQECIKRADLNLYADKKMRKDNK